MDGGGEALHDRGQGLFDYVGKTLNVPADLVGQVERRRGDVEAMLDDAIERALRRLRIPSRHDMDAINQRLDEMSAELKKLNGSVQAKTGLRKRKAAR